MTALQKPEGRKPVLTHVHQNAFEIITILDSQHFNFFSTQKSIPWYITSMLESPTMAMMLHCQFFI